MAFKQKFLSASISLANGQFSGGGNSVDIQGVRMSAFWNDVGGGSAQGEFTIYGLPLSLMNQLTVIKGLNKYSPDNTISIYAWEDGGSPQLAYSGQILTAFFDGANMPQAPFRITSVPGGGGYATKVVKPISQKGKQDVSQLISQLAGQMGLTFENNSVNVTLNNPYYGGSPWTQALQIAKHANIQIIAERGVLAINPLDQPRQSSTPLIAAPQHNPDAILNAYPSFREAFLVVRALYAPGVVKVNGNIRVQSDVSAANGTWSVYQATYQLESMMPHGQWFMTLECTQLGSPP